MAKCRLVVYLLAVIGMSCTAGCSHGGWQTAAVATDEAPGASAITDRYPLLAGRPHEIERVERVVDGDTFTTASGMKIRLIGVDAPEMTGESRPLGRRAAEYADAGLNGKTVWLFSGAADTDRYGRRLRYVFVEGDTVMFNERLVADGFASVLTVPPNLLYAGRFAALELSAREAGSGLWKDGRINGAEKAASTPKK